MRLKICDTCRYLDEREKGVIPAMGDTPAIPYAQGRCHRAPPTAISFTESCHIPIRLSMWCGEHRWSLVGIWRAILMLLRKET